MKTKREKQCAKFAKAFADEYEKRVLKHECHDVVGWEDATRTARKLFYDFMTGKFKCEGGGRHGQ